MPKLQKVLCKKVRARFMDKEVDVPMGPSELLKDKKSSVCPSSQNQLGRIDQAALKNLRFGKFS